MPLRALAVMLFAAVFASGCSASIKIHKTATLSARLLALAAGEAALIPNAKERLSRQLNLAYSQIGRGRHADARRSLADAARTLKRASMHALPEHPRLAGWVSISQLSRRAFDTEQAFRACDAAVHFLKSLEPIGRRPEYVRGVAKEVRALYGKARAAAVLREAGAWTLRMKAQLRRRRALRSIAWDLFLLEDFAGGRATLRHDADASWRFDALLAMAGGSRFRHRSRVRFSPSRVAPSFGKSLSFESYYQH